MKIKKLNKDKLIIIFFVAILSIISIYAFTVFLDNGLGLSYNDARSHLNIGRRVVEGLKPGFAQIGSVWLPLPHALMIPTIWIDFMWHTGLAGAIISMFSYVGVNIAIFLILKELKVSLVSRIIAVSICALNLNTLYLQSTAMTELLLMATMTIACYEFLLWAKYLQHSNLIKTALWVMLATLIRYDGWFLMGWIAILITFVIFTDDVSFLRKKQIKEFSRKVIDKYNHYEGLILMYFTLACFGIFLWVVWNTVIFKDPLYFMLGPFSAKAQQDQLEQAGVLQTKHNLWLSLKFYWYAAVYNSNAYMLLLGLLGIFVTFINKNFDTKVKIALISLIAPFVFNILALYLGHSVLFIQGLSGESWFNVRYGIMVLPSIAVFAGIVVDKFRDLRPVLIGTILAVLMISLYSYDAVTIDDARVGSSQKNVSEVSGWLAKNASDKPGFVLISAASHDAIIFSSGMPMKKFIHEGTGLYWESAVAIPDRWARWIIMRTYDDNDLTWKNVKDTKGFERYNKVQSFPFADIYELKPEYIKNLQYEEIFSKQK